ncbi:hypothetical protein DL764_006878 [Monosporascus ibericus]|uniref:Uncharacterized protein n=1 Tax=Monosporascus ibericus TaxID=155417 RepID=A0A4Q4T3L2_9PEZI|nr:hypothetical protein DL764_006878 [Monosporascus ibericus]
MVSSANNASESGGLQPRQSVGISAHVDDYTHVSGHRDARLHQRDGARVSTRTSSATPRAPRTHPIRLFPLLLRNGNETETTPIIPEGLTLHIRAEPLTGRLRYFVGDDEQQPTWRAEFSWRCLTRAPSGFSVSEGAMFALVAGDNQEHRPFDAPEVRFRRVREAYFEEHTPDYDVWES